MFMSENKEPFLCDGMRGVCDTV